MEWYTVNGVKYDQDQLTELATTLNVTATRLASLSTTECIKFLSNIPYDKSSTGTEARNVPEIISSRDFKSSPNEDLPINDDIEANIPKYNSFVEKSVTRASVEIPRFGWAFVHKCANKCRRVRYKVVVFSKKYDKVSPKTLKSVEQDSRYTGISYEELISPYTERPDQPFHINLDQFINYEFGISDSGDHDSAANAIRNILTNRHSNEYSGVLSKEHKTLLNSAFSKSRKFLTPSLTFTKLYNLREKMFKLIDIIPALDPATVAAGWVLFERLVTSNYVIASNRKLYAGVCLIISFKFYQDDTLNILSSLTNALQSLDSHSNMTVRNIFSLELHIFTLLRFDLALNFSHVSSHLNHYLRSRNVTFNEFYGISNNTQ